MRSGYARRKQKHPLYATWAGMKQRCSDPNHIEWERYGARGIRVCERWAASFPDFLEDILRDIGMKPGKGFSLDRIDNTKGYEPDNVRWASHREQMRNMRDNHLITFEGRTQILQDWANELQIDQSLLRYRLKHWTVERAFKTPIRGRRS